MPTTPRTGKFPSTTVSWDDGSTFDGFILISYVPSTRSGTSYTEVDYGDIYPTETLPQFAVIPIQKGLINSSLSLYFNEDLSPPGSTYIARWYDTTKRLISGPSSSFTVSSNPMTTLTIPTLTAPTSGGTAPVPD